LFYFLVTNFAKQSNDLKALSIPDLSVLALAYELIKEQNKFDRLRKEPLDHTIIDKNIEISEYKKNKAKEEDKETEDGFTVVKSKKKSKLNDFYFFR
jgi:hypothetical protein